MTRRDATGRDSLAGQRGLEVRRGARSFGLGARGTHVRDASELEAVISPQAHEPTVALIVLNEEFTIAPSHGDRIAGHLLSSTCGLSVPFFAELGGLISYGVHLSDNFSACGDLCRSYSQGPEAQQAPVQAPVKFEVVINLKTARRPASACLRCFSSARTR